MTQADLVVPRRAILSVSDKADLVDFAKALIAFDVQLISTGGTASALRAANLPVTDIAEITGTPEILDGRVKTLHPAVHGGLLARRDNPEHMAALEAHSIQPVDLLVVNLYPFEETVASGADIADCLEQIDIGGPAMLRAAAKNFASVAVITRPEQYAEALEMLATKRAFDLAFRQKLALATYQRTASYDAAISRWLATQMDQAFPESLTLTAIRSHSLRYGENPHQSAAIYRTNEAGPSVVNAALLYGKPLSFNNINDADAAFELIADMNRFGRAAVAIIKHANPCGAALAENLARAYETARLTDPTSAFGGVIACNRDVDGETARKISAIFTEVIVAPGFSAEALSILTQKPNLRLLATGGLPKSNRGRICVTSLRGGILAQNADDLSIDARDLKIMTKRSPTADEMADLIFAWTIAKHVKSNAIVYAKERATVGVGAGQMSRVDSARIAAWKAQEMVAAGEESPTIGSVVASDAFFPFADGVLTAAKAGATAVIQPGGSMRDEAVIAAADGAGMAMVFTGMRHFRH